MSYQPYHLQMPMEQIKKLSKGQTVRVDPKHHGGSAVAYLTKPQIAKLKKAHAGKKGANLRLSQAQIRHHKKVGGSFFGDLWSGIKSGVSKAVNWVKDNPEKALDYGRKAVKLVTGVGITLTPDQLKEISSQQKKKKGKGSIFLPGHV